MGKGHDFGTAKRGAVVPQGGKTRIGVHIDDEILEVFRSRADAAGRGYQTTTIAALREYLRNSRRPVDVQTFRRVHREELRSMG
jgi:hypothetical protein